jgi:hypothetical protein
MDSTAARSAVHAKFHAEEMKWLAEEDRQTDKIARQSRLAGMTGIQKIQGEGANRIAEIETNPDLDWANKQIQKEAANNETNAQIAAEQRSFSQEIDALADASAAHQVQGFARIRADATRELDALQKKFDETYGHMDRSTPGGAAAYAAGSAQLQKGRGSILTGEQASESELARRNADETQKIETEARMKFYSAEKQKTSAIQAELEERKRMYFEELQAQQISQDDYNRRVIAAQQEANAQMVEPSKEAREKMAHQFTDFFEGMEHPKQYLAKLGDKAAGEAAASLMQRFGVGGNGQEGHQGGVSGLMSRIGLGPSKKNADAMAERPGGMTHTQAGTFSVASATIHIGSAMISGAGISGGVAGASTGGGGWSGGSGSTSLFTPGSSGASGGAGGAPTDEFGAPLPGTSGAGGPGNAAKISGGLFSYFSNNASTAAAAFGAGGASGGSAASMSATGGASGGDGSINLGSS